jgi:hypothetical protein
VKAADFALCMVLGCMILAAPAWAQTPNLSGEWEAPFTVGTDTPQPLQVEDVRIQQSGNAIEATKITGDQYVPAGTVDLRGTFTSSPFAAQQRCYDPGFKMLFWDDVTVTILDKDHFKVEGGCSGDVTWKRKGGVPIS